MKAGAHIKGEYNREMWFAKSCENEIAELRKKIENLERRKDRHLAAAARWAAGTDIEVS